MGGHALKKVQASRINLEQYNNIKQIINLKLKEHVELEFIIDVPGKLDFGDIDVLYCPFVSDTDSISDSNANSTNIVDLIKKLFNPVEIVPNGPVCSFAYYIEESDKYFQIDLIRSSNLVMSRFYFSYGDLGGIIGRLTQHKSLTFGSEGLWVVPYYETVKDYLVNYSDSDNNLLLKKHILPNINHNESKELISRSNFDKVLLTNDPEEICKYIGLDYSKWKDGFGSKQEIFDWVNQSNWFDLDSFRALDFEHRHRANKRPMYQEFIKYIFVDEPNFTIEKGNSLKYQNENLQLKSIIYFGKQSELTNQINNIWISLERKKKFTGKKFIDLGIEQNQMKNTLEEFKKNIEKDFNIGFEQWIDNNDQISIDLYVGWFIAKYMGSQA